jgi:hypothetical protein
MFSDAMLMKLFGLKRKVVTGGWKKPHNEELYYYNTSYQM